MPAATPLALTILGKFPLYLPHIVNGLSDERSGIDDGLT